MTTNARIRILATGVSGEMIAEQTHLFYNQATGGGSVSFQGRESLFVNGAYQPLTGDYDILQADVADIATRKFASVGAVDRVTGADLSKISTGGIMLIIKAAYDTLYNERAAAEAGE